MAFTLKGHTLNLIDTVRTTNRKFASFHLRISRLPNNSQNNIGETGYGFLQPCQHLSPVSKLINLGWLYNETLIFLKRCVYINAAA